MIHDLVRRDRDLRVDFFRGLALAFIFVDHIPSNALSHLTLRNFGYADATEMFILLAGYSAGIAYGGRQRRDGYMVAAAHLLRRVWTLYVAHIFLFVIFTAQVAYSARVFDAAAYLEEMHVAAFLQEPDVAVLHALTLHFQPAFMNILPLYIVVMLMFVPLLPLLRWPAALLAASGALYLFVQAVNLQIPAYGGGTWFFNPLAWQFLFLIGAVLGHAGTEARQRWIPLRRWLVWLCIAYAAFAFVGILIWQVEWIAQAFPRRLAAVLFDLDKSNLGPKRLLHILALAYLTAHFVPREAAFLRSPAIAPVILCGQRSLPVFCFGIFLSYAGALVMVHFSNSPAAQGLVNVVGFGLQVGAAAISAWFDSSGRARRGAADAAAPAVAPSGEMPAGLVPVVTASVDPPPAPAPAASGRAA